MRLRDRARGAILAGVRALTALFMLVVAGCNAGTASPSDCTTAGGKCLSAGSTCPNRGGEACNPDQDPPGAFCCLPCPSGGASDGGSACR